jgi:hypothetical protein
MNEDKTLMVAIMIAAADLIQTYNSGLSTETTKTRMLRIADDLIGAAYPND